MNRLNVGHYVIGMEGVALLRTWLEGDRGGAGDRVRELTRFVGSANEGPLAIQLEVPEKDTREGYAAWSSTYDTIPNPLIMMEEPAVRALVDRLPPGRALDAACGTGRHAAYLASRGHRVVGVDASPEMLEKAREKSPTVEFRVGDLTSLPVESGSVDLALCSLALTHVPDLVPPMREFARVVRPGGQVVLSDQHPVMALLGGTAFFVASDGSFAYVTSYLHPHNSYVAAFQAAGLAIHGCQEPTWREEDVVTMLQGGGLTGIADDAIKAALVGTPGALVWKLTRSA